MEAIPRFLPDIPSHKKHFIDHARKYVSIDNYERDPRKMASCIRGRKISSSGIEAIALISRFLENELSYDSIVETEKILSGYADIPYMYFSLEESIAGSYSPDGYTPSAEIRESESSDFYLEYEKSEIYREQLMKILEGSFYPFTVGFGIFKDDDGRINEKLFEESKEYLETCEIDTLQDVLSLNEATGFRDAFYESKRAKVLYDVLGELGLHSEKSSIGAVDNLYKISFKEPKEAEKKKRQMIEDAGFKPINRASDRILSSDSGGKCEGLLPGLLTVSSGSALIIEEYMRTDSCSTSFAYLGLLISISGFSVGSIGQSAYDVIKSDRKALSELRTFYNPDESNSI